jgi:hypothetical protein
VKIIAERKLLKKEELEKALAAAETKVEDATKAAATAKKALENEEKILAQLAASSDAWKSTEERRAIFAAQKNLADVALIASQAEAEKIEANLARLGGSACLLAYSAKMELLPPAADLRQRFVADLAHSPLRDDDVKLAVNSSGLLTSANVIATDRTADIIVELAGAIGQFGGSDLAAQSADAAELSATCPDDIPKFIYQFDPVTETPKINEELSKADFPFQVETRLPNCGTDCAPGSNRRTIIDPDRVGHNRGKAVSLNEAALHRGRWGALFYATPSPVTLVLRQCEKPGKDCTKAKMIPVDAAQVMLPQAGPVSYIPMQSSAFVKTVNDATFDNGMLTAWNASRPSELLEVVRLPVRVLTSVISVPAQILSLRVNLSDQERALAATQQELIKQQTRLACMKIASEQGRPPESCLEE